jgi:hypothetical protein
VKPGLAGPFEKVVDVGVLNPVGDWGKYAYCWPGLPVTGLYVSMLIIARLLGSFAMASGAGLRLRSSGMPILEAVEPMLEADKFRLCPRLGPA